MDLFSRIAAVLPKLKGPIQLLGVLMLIGGALAYRTVSPEYVKGVFSAGSIGIFFLIFGQAFNILPSIPSRQRSSFIIILVIIFSVFVVVAIIATAYFVATADAHVLNLRKFGSFVRASSEQDVKKLVDYIRTSQNCEFSVVGLQEANLILGTIEKSNNSTPEESEFAADWSAEEASLQKTICRFVLSLSDERLAASNFSKSMHEIQLEQLKGKTMAISTGKNALDMLIGISEKEEDDPVRVAVDINNSVDRFITVAYSSLYSQMAFLPQRDADVVDHDFIEFAKKIPSDFSEIVKGGVFADTPREDFITFECDSPAEGGRAHSYSRFVVPKSAIRRQSIIDQMEQGPWPIGNAADLFSEHWWLQYAIWQMLAREHGEYRTNLAVRLRDFGQCGPP